MKWVNMMMPGAVKVVPETRTDEFTEIEIIDSVPRRAWLAAAMSLFCVGLGHVYCGRVARGVKLFASSLVVVPVVLVAAILPPSTVLLLVVVAAGLFASAVFLFALVDAFRIARRRREGIRLSRWNHPGVYAACVMVGIGAPWLGSALMREVAFRGYYIPADSMAPAIRNRDRILVNQMAYVLREPRRWEVAAHLDPDDSPPTRFAPSVAMRRPRIARMLGLRGTMVTRVVGLPGDRIESLEGRLILNGEPVLGERGKMPHTKDHIVSVPADGYYVLGDNREGSNDSRRFGIVPADHMLGPVEYIVYPFGRFRSLSID